MEPAASPLFWQVAKKQLGALGLILLLLVLVSLALFINDRQQEWHLRKQQATHRLELAFQLIDRDLERVRSDVRFVAQQGTIRAFDSDDDQSRSEVEREFKNFLRSQQTFQQIRLLDLNGQEKIRVDWHGKLPEVVPRNALQNKSDRHYVRESLRIDAGEVFVSEFDLNQERGKIELPLTPVIRFVTAVNDDSGERKYLLVVNYLGAPLLKELKSTSMPGKVLLVRSDGQYLLGPQDSDAWGWLLEHQNSFDRQFPNAWKQKENELGECFRTSEGAFAFQQVQLNPLMDAATDSGSKPKPFQQQNRLNSIGNTLFVTSYFRPDDVFKNSHRLLNRLLILFAMASVPLFFLTRFWASASAKRSQQNHLIQVSERKQRALSGRLLRIQEEERKAISREIHDQLGQQATAINLDVKLAAQSATSAVVREQLERAIGESAQLLETLHDFASRVRPVELDDLGLCDAIESHLQDFHERTAIQYQFTCKIYEVKLPSDVSENVFRLVQESLNNVSKHSKATHVDVSIRISQSTQPKQLELTVRDDGVGVLKAQEIGTAPSALNDNGRPNRLGVLGMRERVDLLGGEFSWNSMADTGTTVNVTIPIHEPDQ